MTVRAILLDTATGDATDVVVSLARGAIDASVVVDTEREGQPPIMLEDLVAVDEIVKGDRGWREAMARRGVTDLDLVRPCPLSAGAFGIQGEEGRRMLGCSPSSSTTRRTTRGRTRSTAWSPTWT